MKLYQKALLIFLVGITIRGIALGSLKGEASLFYRDSYTYVQVAKNLLQYGVYSMGKDAPPYPDNFRTPLYPFFLVPFVSAHSSYYIPVLIQEIVMSFTAFLIFLLARRLVPENHALFGALLFALEPFGALISSQLMTEAFFTLFFATALLLSALYIKEGKRTMLFSAAVLLAIAALLKAFAFLFVAMIPVAVLLSHSTKKWREGLIALALFSLIVAPWFIRNAVTLKTLDFSSQNGFNLYSYNANAFSDWLHSYFPTTVGKPLEKIDLSSINERYDTRIVPSLKSAAFVFITAHPASYAIFHILHMPLLFTNAAYDNIVAGISFLRFDYLSEAGIYDALSTGRFGTTIRELRDYPVLAILLFANLFFIAVAILALLNPWIHKALHRIFPRDVFFLVLAILYYALLSSPISGARLRIPLNPILFLLASNSVMMVWKLKNKKYALHA